MKNNYKQIIFVLLLIVSFKVNLYADDFDFTAKKLDIQNNGKTVIGSGDVKILSKNEIIKSNSFEFDKDTSHLKLFGNVSIVNTLNDTIVYADRIDYFKNEKKFISDGKVKAQIQDKYIIYSKNLTYLKENLRSLF